MCREQPAPSTNAQTGAQLPGHRIQPPAELPVVDLRLLPGLRRVRAPAPSPATGAISSGRFAATYRRKLATLRRQAALVPQPLVDRRHPHPGLQLRDDVIAVHARSPATSPAAAGYRPAPGTTPGPAPPTRSSLFAARPAPCPPPPPERRTSGASCGPPPGSRAISFFDRPACQCTRISQSHRSRRTFSLPSAPRRHRREEGCSFSMARSTTTRTPSPWGIT